MVGLPEVAIFPRYFTFVRPPAEEVTFVSNLRREAQCKTHAERDVRRVPANHIRGNDSAVGAVASRKGKT